MMLGVYNTIPTHIYFIIDDRCYMARNLKNLVALYKGEINPDGFFEQIIVGKIYIDAIQRDKTNIIFEKEYDNIDNLIYDNIEELI